MDPTQVERMRRTLRRRPKPPWRVLWRGTPPAPWADMRSRPRWQARPLQWQAGWELLWTQRLRRDLDPIYGSLPAGAAATATPTCSPTTSSAASSPTTTPS